MWRDLAPKRANGYEKCSHGEYRDSRRRKKVKAAVIHEHGGLDRVKIEEVPEPEPGRGQVIVEVRAAALNHLDIWVRKGRPGLSLRMPHVLGSDAAGVVAEIGEGVEDMKPGDEVILNPATGVSRASVRRLASWG
jgi:NADPH:quinone reductase-like Zn-dependent oxidoreductase